SQPAVTTYQQIVPGLNGWNDPHHDLFFAAGGKKAASAVAATLGIGPGSAGSSPRASLTTPGANGAGGEGTGGLAQELTTALKDPKAVLGSVESPTNLIVAALTETLTSVKDNVDVSIL
ncbi:hypothetical protein HK102_005648, partial [Quaeritorhiza haematococci]